MPSFNYEFPYSTRKLPVFASNMVASSQHLAATDTTLALLPPVERGVETHPTAGRHVRVEQAQRAQVQQHLGHAAREVDAHGRMGTGWQRIDQPRHGAVDGHPVLDRRPRHASGMGDGGHVQQQVRRPAEGHMRHHRVTDGSGGHERPCRPAEATLRLGEAWRVQASDELLKRLRQQYGAGAVEVLY